MKEKKDWHPFPEETYLEEMEAKAQVTQIVRGGMQLVIQETAATGATVVMLVMGAMAKKLLTH